MHTTNCMQSIEKIAMWEVFRSMCASACIIKRARGNITYSASKLDCSRFLFIRKYITSAGIHCHRVQIVINGAN